jgi:hypothetical protein
LIFLGLSNNLNFETEGRLTFRKVNRETRYKNFSLSSFSNFDTEVNELKLELDAALVYTTEKLKSNFRILFTERDEKNKVLFYEGINNVLYEQRKESEEQKNNNSIYGTITFGADYLITKKDRISLNFYQSKLKYDTPSLLNDDDRDEILSIFKLEYFRVINPFFSFYINTEGSQSHLVYIYASKSSNNNINRVIRLRTGSEFNTSNLISSNIFEVSANYTSYDFEDLNSNLKSFSYRQFTALDSSSFLISKNVHLNILAYMKLSEQGDFSWGSFSERPKRFLQEIFFEPKLLFALENHSFAFGLRYFKLSTYNYKDRMKIFDNSYTSYGPLSIIGVRLYKNLSIYFLGYYELIEISNFQQRQQANMNLNINWNF